MVSHIRNGHSGQRKEILDPGFQIGREDVLFVITDSRGCLHGNAWRRFPLSIHSGRMEGIFLSHSDTICWTHLIRRMDAFKASGNGKNWLVPGIMPYKMKLTDGSQKKFPKH